MEVSLEEKRIRDRGLVKVRRASLGCRPTEEGQGNAPDASTGRNRHSRRPRSNLSFSSVTSGTSTIRTFHPPMPTSLVTSHPHRRHHHQNLTSSQRSRFLALHPIPVHLTQSIHSRNKSREITETKPPRTHQCSPKSHHLQRQTSFLRSGFRTLLWRKLPEATRPDPRCCIKQGR